MQDGDCMEFFAFAQARGSFLARLLKSAHIFNHDLFREKYENQARSNIEREIERLRSSEGANLVMATKTQKSVVQYELKAGGVELREMPIPEIDDDHVLLKVGAVSVCGSDIHQMH